MNTPSLVVLGALGITLASPLAGSAEAAKRTMTEILAASTPADWRPLDEANALYLELDSGRVVFELAPEFAPRHVANIKALAREGYYDGVAIVRSQDNYVVQWGDPDGKKAIRNAQRTLAAELDRAIAADLPFTRLPDGDVYAPEVGISNAMPAARDPKSGRTWLTHCYGMLGVGRDETADSGSGAELYVVNGHAPRHLDRNVTLVGRVVKGIELLTTMPRGTAAMGFYEKPEQRIAIRSIKVAADVPAAQRTALEVMRTDTATFVELIESRRNRPDQWFINPAGHIDLCNVPLPVRAAVK